MSIAGATLGEYAELARRVGNTPGIAGIEVNLAAVEPAAGGLKADLARGFARDPMQAARVVAVVRRETAAGVPVFAKLWPGVAGLVDMASAVSQAGASGVVLPGSLPGLALDPRTLRPQLGGGTGELSGPAIRSVGLYAVWEVRRALPDACIIGAGGIRSGARRARVHRRRRRRRPGRQRYLRRPVAPPPGDGRAARGSRMSSRRAGKRSPATDVHAPGATVADPARTRTPTGPTPQEMASAWTPSEPGCSRR